ncbi:hypothetical protein Moror_10644 [Moniliophthora roreri MCA 2997]|uniref:C2 NT-type domain-containing protein n=1 Tax=Moniliophthora roreri (strain MCA 2997) TaxID=1381753 RepID=V2YJ58_MONRO|nr:hypothetical protein Moror_10644 [Moniliophthora roreri MCA 2997]
MPHSTAASFRSADHGNGTTPKPPKTPERAHHHNTEVSHGLRAHLQHLLPRHAIFHVHVQIHQISSVPLVHGQFGVRWKFRRVKSSAGTPILPVDKAKGKSRNVKGKGKAVDENGSIGSAEASLASSLASMSDSYYQIPSVVISGEKSPSPHTHSMPASPFLMQTPSLESSRTSLSQPSSTSSVASSALSPLTPVSSASSTPGPEPTPNVATYSPGRGHTPFYKLTDHAVKWEHPLNVLVKMDIDRETSALQPSELKLVVMQRVISGDPDAPHNPRLGAVYLNLAEYAGVGEPVTRRYLLRESKTNATLKLTTQVTFVSGDSHYIAPPLPKGEIMNGVAGLLDSDVYRTRPHALELWGPYYNKEELEMDLLGGASIPDPNNPLPRHKRLDTDDEAAYHDAATSDSDYDSDDDRYEVPFDVSRLPLAYGPKTTEILIEALFNPVKVVKPHARLEKERESPFEVFVDAAEEVARKEENRRLKMDKKREREAVLASSVENASHGGGAGDRDRTIGRWNGFGFGSRYPTGQSQQSEVASVYSMEDNSSTGHHTNSTGEHSVTGPHENDERGRTTGVKAWLARKMTPASGHSGTASRPGTPVRRLS